MNKIYKRLAALGIALLLCVGLLPAANAAQSSFADITDAKTAEHVEVLRMMGIIDGMNAATFAPEGTLTRAQFCKMAIVALGRADQVGSYKNYTIFPDVKGSHWAAGYVNMAVRGEGKFISGFTNGTFGPDRTITYGQAITILMRLLGYTDADVGIVWPEGYINAAVENGLTDGVRLAGNSPLTRAQAARLFVNLLNANTKNGGKFLSTVGNAVGDVILLNANTTDETGAAAVLTSSGTYPIATRPGGGALTGRKGMLLLNNAGKVLTFIPTNVGESRDITIASAAADALTDTDGVKYKVFSDTVTYYKDERGTYGADRVFFRAGTHATVYIGLSGHVEHIVVGSGTSDDAVIVADNGSTAGFGLLTDRTDYAIYKNGEKVTAAELKKFDVATYSAATNTVYVSDERMTVYYKNAYPGVASPSTITVTGISTPLTVLHCGVESLSRCRLGQTIVIMLTHDGRVAGVSSGLSSNAVGYAEETCVRLFNGLTIDEGLPQNMGNFAGSLVQVTAGNKSSVSLSKLSSSGVGGALDIAARKVGVTPLAGNVRVYEKVGTSALHEISLADIPAQSVPASKVAYARKNYAGKIDVLVLDDVTGSLYTYGRLTITEDDMNRYVTVRGSAGESVGPMACAVFTTEKWGGVVPSADGKRTAAAVTLKAVKNVPASAWRSKELVWHSDVLYTVAENVPCYNKVADVWFANVSDALAFGEKMTLYIDANNIVRGVEVG